MATPGIENSHASAPLGAAIDWKSIRDFHPAKITRFRHNLDREPLLDVASLRGVAKRLHPEGHVKFKPAKQG
ncbi:MAG TPA: hypothetical protein VIY73_03075, partial [Polyangiaceae bacterium]